MDIYQLKTFVGVAREGSITRASESLYLSQPAVSAHIKALEDELGLLLFERTTRGMSLTANGASLLVKAEQIIAMHRALIDEAKRMKGSVNGKIRIGVNRNSSSQILGRLLAKLSETFPEIEVALEYGSSTEIVHAIQTGLLDVGFYTDQACTNAELETIEISRFRVFLAAPLGWVEEPNNPDWQRLANMPWIYPATSTCCGRLAENLFEQNGFRPLKVIHVDQESVTRTLIAGGVGLGFLHAPTARDAQAKGEVVLLENLQQEVQLLFAYRRERANVPLIEAVATTVRHLGAD